MIINSSRPYSQRAHMIISLIAYEPFNCRFLFSSTSFPGSKSKISSYLWSRGLSFFFLFTVLYLKWSEGFFRPPLLVLLLSRIKVTVSNLENCLSLSRLRECEKGHDLFICRYPFFSRVYFIFLRRVIYQFDAVYFAWKIAKIVVIALLLFYIQYILI